MNILIIGYWSASEGLSQATIFNDIKILAGFEEVSQIFYTSVERKGDKIFEVDLPKTKHLPLKSKFVFNTIVTKIIDYVRFPAELTKIVENYNITAILCAGSPAGNLGYLVSRKRQVPYYSYLVEPHGKYMLDSGVWKRYDPRYLVQEWGEAKQKESAELVLPVSTTYQSALLQEGVEKERLSVIPCTVDLNKFSLPTKQEKLEVRKKLGINQCSTVGIYLGKFGGLYYTKEAGAVFKKAFSVFENLHILIVSPQPKVEIEQILSSQNVDLGKVTIRSAAHHEVPTLLKAADHAYTFYRSSPIKIFQNPVKIGEYWATGLPIFHTKGVGDDTFTIEREGGGVVYTLETLQHDIQKFADYCTITSPNVQVALAKKYRSPDISKRELRKIVDHIGKQNVRLS
jgi:hypothetical protein